MGVPTIRLQGRTLIRDAYNVIIFQEGASSLPCILYEFTTSPVDTIMLGNESNDWLLDSLPNLVGVCRTSCPLLHDRIFDSGKVATSFTKSQGKCEILRNCKNFRLTRMLNLPLSNREKKYFLPFLE